MEARTEASLMEMIDLMVDEPDGYFLITAKREAGGTIRYSYVISDALHIDHLLNRASDLFYVSYEESSDDIE